MTKHDAVHKIRQSFADLHLAERELEGLDKYMTDEHYACRRDRTMAFIKSAKAILEFTIDRGIGQDLTKKEKL